MMGVMSSFTPEYREFHNPATLKRLREVAADFQWDKWAQKITFLPYFRMQLLLALTRYATLTERRAAMQQDPLFALYGARLEVWVSGLAQVHARRGSAPFAALLEQVFPRVAELPQQSKRWRVLTTATLFSIQHLLAQTQIVDSSTFKLPPPLPNGRRPKSTGAVPPVTSSTYFSLVAMAASPRLTSPPPKSMTVHIWTRCARGRHAAVSSWWIGVTRTTGSLSSGPR